ncbi:hypothetical protein G7046_g930 [Stylonectria norvegica]|nr:hypothetical protein G7046_g930 [Stylonectria norvegica]
MQSAVVIARRPSRERAFEHCVNDSIRAEQSVAVQLDARAWPSDRDATPGPSWHPPTSQRHPCIPQPLLSPDLMELLSTEVGLEPLHFRGFVPPVAAVAPARWKQGSKPFFGSSLINVLYLDKKLGRCGYAIAPLESCFVVILRCPLSAMTVRLSRRMVDRMEKAIRQAKVLAFLNVVPIKFRHRRCFFQGHETYMSCQIYVYSSGLSDRALQAVRVEQRLVGAKALSAQLLARCQSFASRLKADDPGKADDGAG